MSGLNGVCAFCGAFSIVADFNGYTLCDGCTERAKQLVARELMKLAVPYLAKQKQVSKQMNEQKKSGGVE